MAGDEEERPSKRPKLEILLRYTDFQRQEQDDDDAAMCNTPEELGSSQHPRQSGQGAEPPCTEGFRGQLEVLECQLCSQQLQSPLAGGGEASLSVPAEDIIFSIKCSQSYERPLTQTQSSFRFWDTDDQNDPGVVDTPHLADAPAGPFQSERPRDEAGPSQQPQPRAFAANASQPQVQPGPLQELPGPRRSTGGASVASSLSDPHTRSVTPELATEDDLEVAGKSPELKLFPMFRPKSQRKLLHCVRHGESTFNRASKMQASFAEPFIFDAELTDLGRQQATAVRETLRKLKGLRNAVWVVSPLQRTIQTFTRACPFYVDALQGGDSPAGAASPALPSCSAPGSPEVFVLRDVAEHCVTSGDIGSPASLLRDKHPQLASAMVSLKERWWFRPDVNDAQRKAFGKSEPRRALNERIGAFRRWVAGRPEKVIVLIGHSTYIKNLTGMGRHLANCELHTHYL